MSSKIQSAIELVGDRGRYQKILLVFFIFVNLELGLILLGSSFIFMNPTFQCQGLTSPSEDNACKILDQCTITNDFTVTNYAKLICDRQNDRSIIQSAPYIGSIIGLLLLTPFADQYGKRFMFILSQWLVIFGITFNIIGAYTTVAAIIVVGQILIGAGCYCILIIAYVILSELTQSKFKQYSIIILNAIWAFSQILISGFYFWYNEWQNYIIYVMLVPNVALFIFSLFFLVESPYFLLQKKGDINGAIKAMRTIAKYNRIDNQKLSQVEQLFKEVLVEIQEKKQQEGKSQQMSRFAIFKDAKYLKILLLVAVLQIGANAYYYGVQFSLGQIGTNFGYNILLTGVIQTIAFFSSNVFITKVPRKKGMLIFNLVSIGLGLLFFISWIKDTMVAQTILLGACRFFNAYTMSIVPMMQNECFPHRYRSMAWGYIEGISQMGNFVTPYIVTACQDGGINPLIIFSFILAVIGTVPLLFIKETLNVKEDDVQSEQNLKDSMQSQEQSLIQSDTAGR